MGDIPVADKAGGLLELAVFGRTAALTGLDIDDPRWQARVPDPLVKSDWFRGLPVWARSRYCLSRTCAALELGVELETLLSVGLRRYADSQLRGSPEQRRVRLEVAEEASHSEMFRHFVARVREAWPALPAVRMDDVLGVTRWQRWLELAVNMPELLFMFALCGEEPINTLQHWYLQGDRSSQHPLLRSIYSAHVEDEANHVSYAREVLAKRLHGLASRRRNRLLYLAPTAAVAAARQLVWPANEVVEAFRVPVVAFSEPLVVRAGRQLVRLALGSLVQTFEALGITSRADNAFVALIYGVPRGEAGRGPALRRGTGGLVW